MIELKNVCYSVKDERTGEKQTILENVNLTFPEKSITVITGPNGSGKSTLIKLLMGIEKPTSGKIYFGNEEIQKQNYYRTRETRLYDRISAARTFQGHHRKKTSRRCERQKTDAERTVRLPLRCGALRAQLYRPHRRRHTVGRGTQTHRTCHDHRQGRRGVFAGRARSGHRSLEFRRSRDLIQKIARQDGHHRQPSEPYFGNRG